MLSSGKKDIGQDYFIEKMVPKLSVHAINTR